MSAIHFILSQIDINTLGWTLVHFLWQGTVIAILLKGVNLLSNNANVRYGFSCFALSFVIAAPILTFSWLYTPKAFIQHTYPIVEPMTQSDRSIEPINIHTHTSPPIKSINSNKPQSKTITPTLQPTVQSQPTWPQQITDIFNQNLTWFVCLWLFGVVLLSLRLLYIWLHTQHLKYNYIQPVHKDWENLFIHLLNRLKIRQTVRLLESTIAQSPMVIGWFKPVILIPTSAFLGLTPQQIETILVHELAHIRRYDYLINLLQTLVETVLFYHPAVWWISRQMRIEREHCCDDFALKTCGNAITYAQALTQLETHRHLPAVAASDGSLRQRIQRILSDQPTQTHYSRTPFGTGLIILLGIALLFAFNTTTSPKIEAATPFTNIEQITSADSAIAHVKNRYMAFDFEAGFLEGEQLQKRFPTSSELKAWTIWNMARSGSPFAAVGDAEKIIQKNENDPWGWYALTGALGYSEHQEEFRTRAYEAHKKFLAINPTYPDSIWFIATVTHRQFDFKKDQIIPYVDAHVHTAPNPDYLLTLKGFILGWMAKRKNIHPIESRRRFAAALDAFENARLINPQNVWAYHLPGIIYAENNRHAEAMFLFENALKISAKSPYICEMYLRSLYQSARPEKYKKLLAQAVIDTMLQDRETYPQTYHTAMRNYGRFGLSQKIEQLEEYVLQNQPNHSLAAGILDKRNTIRTYYTSPHPITSLEVSLHHLEQMSSSILLNDTLTDSVKHPQLKPSTEQPFHKKVYSFFINSTLKDSTEHPRSMPERPQLIRSPEPQLDQVIVSVRGQKKHFFFKNEMIPRKLVGPDTFEDFTTHLQNSIYQPQMSQDSLFTIAKRTMALKIPEAYRYQWRAIIAFLDKNALLRESDITPFDTQVAYANQIESFAQQIIAQAHNQTDTIEAKHIQTDTIEAKHIQALGYDALGWLHLKERRWDEAQIALEKARDLAPNGTILYHLGKYHEKMNEPEIAEQYYAQGVLAPLGTDQTEWALRKLYNQKHRVQRGEPAHGFYAHLEQLAFEKLDRLFSDTQ